MKTVSKIAGVIVVCLVLLLVVLSITGLEPRQRTPGLWLKGTLVTTPVADWSFTDKIDTVKVQTRTWYLLPHSVTTYCVAYNGQLYLDSFYPPGVAYPHGRSWNENVARDPHVRLKIGNNLYDVTLSHVTDPAEKAALRELKAKKYPQLKIPPDAQVQLFHVIGWPNLSPQVHSQSWPNVLGELAAAQGPGYPRTLERYGPVWRRLPVGHFGGQQAVG